MYEPVSGVGDEAYYMIRRLPVLVDAKIKADVQEAVNVAVKAAEFI